LSPDDSPLNDAIRAAQAGSPEDVCAAASGYRLGDAANVVSHHSADEIDSIESDAAFSPLSTRIHQMFPSLSVREIERMHPFGFLANWKAGEALFTMGRPRPGLVVILSGLVRVTRRNAMGKVHRVTEQHAGHFLGEIAQLYGHPCFGDGLAIEQAPRADGAVVHDESRAAMRQLARKKIVDMGRDISAVRFERKVSRIE